MSHVMKNQASLGRRSLVAGVWAGGGHALALVIRLAGNLLLARIMLPEAFGVMAVVLTVLLALTLLSDIGSGAVVVQSRRGSDEAFLNTAWTLQIIRGFGIWVLGIVIALVILAGQTHDWFKDGVVYDDPRLPMLLAVASFSMVLQGFISTNSRLAERNLDLKANSLIELAVQVLSLTFMVVGAYLTRSIWALALGAIVTSALKCWFTHAFLKGPRPRFVLESTALKELLSKGKWVLLSSPLGFVAMNGDRALLGGLIDATTLGLYSIAHGLAGIAPAAIGAVLMKVVFPAFSEVVRDRRADLPKVYRKFQQITDVCVGFIAAATFCASDSIIDLLYDDRYRNAAPMLAALAIGSLGWRFLVVEQIYLAMGRIGLLAASILPRALVVVAGVPLGYDLAGLNGALVAIVLSQFAHWPQILWFRRKNGINQLRNDLWLPLGLIAGGLIGWGFDRLYFHLM